MTERYFAYPMTEESFDAMWDDDDDDDLPDPGDEIGCIKCGWTGEEWLSVCGGDGWTGKPCPHCAKDKVSA